MNWKILIIEDDCTQNDVLANFLRKENYTVISAYSLKDARRLFDSSVHLVVLDLMLPDGSGLAYLKELRQATDIPVSVLTALEDEYTQIQTFDLKADEYVDKPVSPVVMTKRISALFERVYNKRTLTPICGYQFNFSGLSVHTNRGEEILLTATEMQIIQCLYKNNGITVSRKKLMELIWGFEYIDDDRLLDSHIKNLRQKLEKNIIITVKGIGYRLNIEPGGRTA